MPRRIRLCNACAAMAPLRARPVHACGHCDVRADGGRAVRTDDPPRLRLGVPPEVGVSCTSIFVQHEFCRYRSRPVAVAGSIYADPVYFPVLWTHVVNGASDCRKGASVGGSKHELVLRCVIWVATACRNVGGIWSGDMRLYTKC